MQYAKNTDVSVEKTRAEIERLVLRYGATGFVSGWQDSQAMIEFIYSKKRIRFLLELPDKEEYRRSPSGRRTRSDRETYQAWEQRCRARWRALFLSIKAKLSDVESQIATFEHSFMPNIVMPDGKTVAEHVMPAIEQAYLTNTTPQLLLNP